VESLLLEIRLIIHTAKLIRPFSRYYPTI